MQTTGILPQKQATLERTTDTEIIIEGFYVVNGNRSKFIETRSTVASLAELEVERARLRLIYDGHDINFIYKYKH